LGISETSALNGLQETVHTVIDKASPDGTLMDIGQQLLNRVAGAIDAVSKLSGRTK